MNDPHARCVIVLSVPRDAAARWRELFTAALPGAEIRVREPGETANPDAPRADYVAIYGPCTTLFEEHSTPKAIFALSAGVGHLLALPNLPCSVPLIRLEDAGMADPMIRYVLSAALRFLLRFDGYASNQAASIWAQRTPRSPASIRVGVMGLGVIGGRVAGALVAQGFVVRGYAASPKNMEGVQVFAGTAEIDAFLDQLDVLVSVLPATPATDGMLDRRTLSRLADGAHVINIGRGTILVDKDLIALIAEGKLSGATLDVFRQEPLPPEHPFWRCPSIALTPHISGLTVPEAAAAQVARKIMQLERGEPVSGLVAVEKGY